MPPANQPSYSCPRCGQVDMVQKVSALVEGGTVAGVYSNPFNETPISGVTLSAKASQLKFPSKPIFKKSPWGCGSLILYTLGMGFGLVFSFMFAVSLVLPLDTVNSDAVSHGNQTSTPLDKVEALVFLFILVAICFGVVRLVLRRRDKINAALRAQHQRDVFRWERARGIWYELYYCVRNDVVFIPGKPNECVEASLMSRLIGYP